MGFLDSLKKLFGGGGEPAKPAAEQPQEQAPQAEAAPAETEEKQETGGNV